MIRFFNAPDGARLAYSDEGVGPVLLCLSGLTRTMADFDYLTPHLPACRLIRMDYRGRGASDWTGAATYTIPIEARDVIALLDHLDVGQAAILGTSRGGLIGMLLAAVARERVLGLCLNDIGPHIEPAALGRIAGYLGRNPSARNHADLAASLPNSMSGFENVPPERWLSEARLHYRETPDGLQITYDPALRDAFAAGLAAPAGDGWSLFDACDGLPLALIRGANSDLLSTATAAEMRRRRPEMIFSEVPGRAHIPFLDEPESLAAMDAFLERIG